jgi:hypothetical protein
MTPKFVVDNSIVNSGNPGSSPVWHIDNGCVRHFGSGLESGLGYLEKDLRPTREAIRFMLDLIAQDLPQAQKVSVGSEFAR